ncbi:unnamed protein product [Adineta steineri]|uniref:Uncharacterized protein n=1 Tax=Adineta steineri TaxID=433720 RepID=A0A814FUS2_9BILA|nr:unnamed protein product [Adineta steineri]CAF1190601.1 unnamed protein product [Adineta steineri]CAF1464209.1 unnamed protein product [Adineta steineri]CAF1634042.1 unnamed protein product [Adineta steineri]
MDENELISLFTKADLTSVFHQYCLDGNYNEVQAMISKLTYEELNQIEPNGYTALHAAVLCNHLDIVKLLLNHGCSQTILNRYGRTAYQDAHTDEMRILFVRPRSQRFFDNNTTESFKLFIANGNNIDMKKDIPDSWFKGYVRAEDTRESQFILALGQAPFLIRKIYQNRIEFINMQSLYSLIIANVSRTHKEYVEVNNLYQTFAKKRNIDHLLKLYTLETDIYSALQTQPDSFTILVYLYLTELKERAYRGHTYRGAKMNQPDIAAYRWALSNQNYILETRSIQSMSKDESVAQEFAELQPGDKRYSVIFVYDFPERCKTAIDLTKISNDLPLLSHYEKEQEVTLLPFTLFTVCNIETASTTSQYRITLRNVPVPKQSALMAFKNLRH